MQRRSFLASGLVGLAAAEDHNLAFGQALQQANSAQNAPDTFRLMSRFAEDSGKALFTGAAPPTPVPPQIYLYFDRKTKKFVNPLDVVADLAPAKYTLNVELKSFGLSDASRQTLTVDTRKDLQLTLNVTTAQSTDENDTLSWVFMNAIDVFLGKADATQARLTTFQQNNKPTAALKPVSQISIPQGSIELQVIALGQKQQGFWKTFFSLVTKLSSSPVFAALGLPALVPEALSFANTSLNQLAHTSEPLVPVWQSARIPFGILKDSDADFKLKGGYWVMVDRAYAVSTNYLQDHLVDLEGQTFGLARNDKRLVDANYLVTYFTFAQSKT